MDESIKLLGVTCDTFIKTLEDCMQLSNAKIEMNVSTDVILPPNNIPSHKKVANQFSTRLGRVLIVLLL